MRVYFWKFQVIDLDTDQFQSLRMNLLFILAFCDFNLFKAIFKFFFYLVCVKCQNTKLASKVYLMIV